MSEQVTKDERVHTFETKTYQERANAWHAVFEKMLQNNPSFCNNELTGLQSALRELDRLYATPGMRKPRKRGKQR